jgi:hypothetical protein
MLGGALHDCRVDAYVPLVIRRGHLEREEPRLSTTMWVAATVLMYELGRVQPGKSCKMIKTDFWIRLGLKRVINLKAVLGNDLR